jgi:hypothetical protein
MKNSTKKVIALSLVAGTFLVGCGSTSDDTTTEATDTTTEVTQQAITYSGVASDPELQGATVFLDDNENSLLDEGEPTAATNENGAYTLTISKDQVGKPIIVIGGVDKSTKEDFTGKLTVLTEDGGEVVNVTPLTTLVHQYKLDNPDMDLDAIKAELANKLGLASADELDANTAEAGHEEALKIALQIEKAAQLINESAQNVDTTKVYDSLVAHLKSENDLTTALDKVADDHVSDELAKEKVKDLNHELEKLDHKQFADKDALALSVENIDDAIHNAKDITELQKDLAHDKMMLVENSDEVKKEKEQRLMKHLGLEDLSEEEQQAILAQIDIDDDPKNIENEIHNGKMEGLDSTTKSDMKRDAFFKMLGLNELDDTTLETLKQKFTDANFDFTQATPQDVADKINDNEFMGDDSDFNTKVRDALKTDVLSSLTHNEEEDK